MIDLISKVNKVIGPQLLIKYKSIRFYQCKNLSFIPRSIKIVNFYANTLVQINSIRKLLTLHESKLLKSSGFSRVFLTPHCMFLSTSTGKHKPRNGV